MKWHYNVHQEPAVFFELRVVFNNHCKIVSSTIGLWLSMYFCFGAKLHTLPTYQSPNFTRIFVLRDSLNPCSSLMKIEWRRTLGSCVSLNNNRWLMKVYDEYGLYGWDEQVAFAWKILKAENWDNCYRGIIVVALTSASRPRCSSTLWASYRMNFVDVSTKTEGLEVLRSSICKRRNGMPE